MLALSAPHNCNVIERAGDFRLAESILNTSLQTCHCKVYLPSSRKPPWPNGQGVGPLIRRLRVRVPQGVFLFIPRRFHLHLREEPTQLDEKADEQKPA